MSQSPLTDEEIERASLFMMFCVSLAFVLGMYCGAKWVNFTDNEAPDSTNTIHEIEVPIGKLSRDRFDPPK